MTTATTTSELEYAVKNALCVYIPSQYMVVLRYDWEGEHKQIFCQSAHGGAVNEGWENQDGSLPEGVEKGEYYVVDENNFWGYAEAYWQPNTEVNSPYEESDFSIDEEGRVLSRWN